MLQVNESRRLTGLVEEKLRKNPEIRPFPAAVSQLLAVAQDPNSNAATFEEIIKCDAALSVRLLRMANSPLYGLDREIRGLGHAATILGLRQLKSLALSVSGGSMFAGGATTARERKALWEHSLACATVARLLAAAIGYHHDPGESPAYVEFVKLLHVANGLSKAWGLGSDADPNSDIFSSVSEDLGIDNNLLPGLEDAARDTFREVTLAWA